MRNWIEDFMGWIKLGGKITYFVIRIPYWVIYYLGWVMVTFLRFLNCELNHKLHWLDTGGVYEHFTSLDGMGGYSSFYKIMSCSRCHRKFNKEFTIEEYEKKENARTMLVSSVGEDAYPIFKNGYWIDKNNPNQAIHWAEQQK